jgi:hypothetical protein
LLFIDGENLATSRLLERKARLKALLRRAPKNIYFVDHAIGNGQAFYDATCKHQAEGIVSKRVDAPYKPGDRGIWRKTKCINENEFVVVGFTNPEGRRPYLGAQQLGYYTPDGELSYAGRAGTGINEAELKRLYVKLKPLETKAMTFVGRTAAEVLRQMVAEASEPDLSWMSKVRLLDALCQCELAFTIKRTGKKIQWVLNPFRDPLDARGDVETIGEAVDALHSAARERYPGYRPRAGKGIS